MRNTSHHFYSQCPPLGSVQVPSLQAAESSCCFPHAPICLFGRSDDEDGPATSAEVLRAIEAEVYNSEEDDDFELEEKDAGEDDDEEFAGLVVEEEGIPLPVKPRKTQPPGTGAVAAAASAPSGGIAPRAGATSSAAASAPSAPTKTRQTIDALFADMKAADDLLVATKRQAAAARASFGTAPQVAAAPTAIGVVAALQRRVIGRCSDPTTVKKTYLLKGLSSRPAQPSASAPQSRVTGAVRTILTKSKRPVSVLNEPGAAAAAAAAVGAADAAPHQRGDAVVGGGGGDGGDDTGRSNTFEGGKRARVALSEEAVALAAKARAVVSQVKVAVTETVKFAGKTVEYVPTGLLRAFD